MKKAICRDIENREDEFSCKKYEFNKCCQECEDKNCTGCDYKHDSECQCKEFIEDIKENEAPKGIRKEDLKLYKILKTHYAPKDYATAIKEYVVAKDDKEVFEYLAKGYAGWKAIEDDAICEIEDYNENGNKRSYDRYEHLMEVYNSILEERSDNRDVEDLYYGATQYGWEEVELKNYDVIELMIENKLAKRL